MISSFRKSASGGLLVAAVLLSAMAACSPTVGDDGLFDPITTTNTDYDSAVFVAVGNNPITMDTADYDGDGELDIAVINLLDGNNAFNGSLSLLTNNCVSTPGCIDFTETRIDIAPFATKVKFADLNGGNLDIVVLVNDEDNPHVWFCIDPSTAGCTSTQTFTLAGIAAQMELVDITGGVANNDLLLTIPEADLLTAILSDGAGAYSQVDTTVASKPGKFAAGDFDGDGDDLDVAIVRASNNDAIVLDGDGVGGFNASTPIATLALLSNPVAIAAMDLNGTGLNESFVVVSDTANELRVLANDGVGGFTAVTYNVDKNPGFLLAGDFDGVGNDNDLILMHGKSNFISYFGGNVTLPTPAFTKGLVTVSRDPFAAAAGDVTGTVALDVVVASQEYRAVSILANNGSGSFSYSVIGFTATPTYPLLVPPAFNFSTSTTKSDLILLQSFSDRVVILTNTN